MARVTKQQDARHFQKALKLSCWNSNMIRDMNNDNKFSVYFNDQVEYKRFHPGIGATGAPNGGTVDTTDGADDLSWLYAVGDLRTGYNHQYGFEHGSSDPYYLTKNPNYPNDEVDRMGHAITYNQAAADDATAFSGATANLAGRNNNRLRQVDEAWYDQSYTAGDSDITRSGGKDSTVPFGAGIQVSDPNHSLRPDKKYTFRKWGYQSDNVERHASNGYEQNAVVYHFGHHDNKDNDANRPNMRYAASSDTLNETTATTEAERNLLNRNIHEFDFYGFKDDWRYSLRMGGCLYEAARWVYDESSFHRTGRLTYTDDTLFMNDPFNPMDGTDIFGAHQNAAHTSMNPNFPTANVNIAQLSTTLVNQQAAAAIGYSAWINSTCGVDSIAADASCSTAVTEMGDAYDALARCMEINSTTCRSDNLTFATARASGGCFFDNTGGGAAGVCLTEYNTFITKRNVVSTDSTGGCLDGVATCFKNNTYSNTSISGWEPYFQDSIDLYMSAREQEGYADGALANAQTAINTGLSGSGNPIFLTNNNASLFTQDGTGSWSNAGQTGSNTTADHVNIGDCNGNLACTNANVATPSSGGVFADVHWVHVFNAHIFPLQDVGYYQYDQTLGLGNINENNDSITSRDGYGYNIYKGYANNNIVLRDVWGKMDASGQNYYDTANNAPPGQNHQSVVTADIFHSQYGTVNIGDADTPSGYATGTYATTGTDGEPGATGSLLADFYPILTKTRRKIEDFNVVMANPTYEGHGFLNFVATYHDHTENFEDSTASNFWIRQVGKRFLSTIGGLTTASNAQRNVCRAVKDGIDSYRMNGIAPYPMGATSGTGHDSDSLRGDTTVSTRTPDGHDDGYQGPLGPGPAGNYGNGQRCGAAMYENFGDWFLRPAQTYQAYHNYNTLATTTGDAGWNANAAPSSCTNASSALCLEGFASYNYWAFILSEGYNPIAQAADDAGNDPAAAYAYKSRHELWRNGSLHYDRRGLDGEFGAATYLKSRSSGRGFAISSFPHNELGKDFRFNIRTLHNMGNGVAKQYYQIQNLKDDAGNEQGNAAIMGTLRTSNLRTTETVWSYYFYAVDTIKIAFPEFVARINHCDKHSHRNTSHCQTEFTADLNNGNPDNASDGSNTHGPNVLSAYPGYKDGFPHRRLGFQDIIIDGVTMKKTDNQYDSRATRENQGEWHKQYNNARGLRGDDHTRATLHYADTEFENEDLSLNESNAAMCGHLDDTYNMGKDIHFMADGRTAGETGSYQGYTDSYQPLKPCASWCALDEYSGVTTGFGVDNTRQSVDNTANPAAVTGAHSLVGTSPSLSEYGGICGRILRIDGLLQTYDELHNRQYGTIQEIWVQLQYAYQESLDNHNRTTSEATCNRDDANDADCDAKVRKVQSPFPNVFFSAPEVVDIRGFCPSSNMKCRGYMSDQHQPYGGARNHVERVHWNDQNVRWDGDLSKAFGANQLGASNVGPAQTGSDWTKDRDFRGDSKWPWNYHSYTSSNGLSYGNGVAGTTYTGRDYDHTIYQESSAGKK